MDFFLLILTITVIFAIWASLGYFSYRKIQEKPGLWKKTWKKATWWCILAILGFVIGLPTLGAILLVILLGPNNAWGEICQIGLPIFLGISINSPFLFIFLFPAALFEELKKH